MKRPLLLGRVDQVSIRLPVTPSCVRRPYSVTTQGDSAISEVRVVRVRLTQVLQRAIHHVVDASRQLRGAQDNALHGLEGQLIAPLDRFIRPGVDTVVSPE